MRTADKLKSYHAVLSALRWRDDLFAADKEHWQAMSKPKRAEAIFAAHLARVRGDGSPALCDEALAVAVKR